jgi:hypothetical protein
VSGSDSLDVLNLFGDELGHSVLERLGVSSLARRESPRESGSDLGLSALLPRFIQILDTVVNPTYRGPEGGTCSKEAHCSVVIGIE